MTSNNVAQITAILKSVELLSEQQSQQGADIAFGAVLSQTAGGSKNDMSFDLTRSGNNTGITSDNQAAYEREVVKAGYKESNITQSKTSDISSKLEDMKGKLETFSEDVKEVLQEKLGVTEEELTEAMETLGLTVMDLMEPAKLASLVMELTGSQDIGGLLLSEDFQLLMGDISLLTQDLMSQMQVTPEEMTQLIEQLEKVMQNTPEETTAQDAMLEEGILSSAEELSEDASQNAVQTDVLSEQAESAQKVSEGAQPVKQQAEEHVAEEAEGAQDEAVQTESVKVSAEDDSQSGLTEEDGTQKESMTGLKENNQEAGTEKTGQQQTVSYQTTTQTINQGQTVEVIQTHTVIDVEDVMRQISQMTRVVISQAESSIEMQLNPANLGKVYLQVVSKDGAITAQLAAQNEAVKEVLESQIAVLKENMNQQGMKVEAIEVTIASHEFERNLEENQQNAPQQQEAEKNHSSRRNINLNSLDELEGLMSEEENLVAKIMAEQGNSVDLTA